MKQKFDRRKRKDKWIYDIPDDVCKQMLKRADEALRNCFPKAGKGYAVTVLTKDGNMYEGVSYISDTYTLTMHSEMTALAHAAIHGEKEIVAITGPNCHICKQLLWENSLRSGIDIVIVVEEEGKIRQVPLSEMMPYPWPDSI